MIWRHVNQNLGIRQGQLGAASQNKRTSHPGNMKCAVPRCFRPSSVTMGRHTPSISPPIRSEFLGAGCLATWPWPRCQEEPAPHVTFKPPNEHPVVRQLAGAPCLTAGRGPRPPPQRAAAADDLTSSWGQPSWGQPSSRREQPSQGQLSSEQLWPFSSPRCSKTYLLESDRHESTGPCANSYQIF